MSASNNHDFWRSQESSDPKPAQSGASGSEKATEAPKNPTSSPGATSYARVNKPPLTENGQQSQTPERDGDGSGFDGRRVRMVRSGPQNVNGGRGPSGTPSNGTPDARNPASGRPSPGQGTSASGQNSGAQKRPGTAAPANGAGPKSPIPKNSGSGVTPSASSGIADRLRGGKTTPRDTTSSAAGKDGGVLNKDTGKAAAGEALKQGLKGGLKGAATGGLTGAAKGAAVGAASGAADKINEASAARQQAGTTRGPSNRSGLLSSTAENALSRGQAGLQSRFGSSAGAAGGAGGAGGAGNPAITPEQVANIAKAAMTVQKEVTTTVVKKATTAVGVIVALVFVLVMTMVTAVSGPITSAATAAFAAQSVSCENPSSSGSSTSSPSPSPSPSSESSASAAYEENSGISLVSDVSVMAKTPVLMNNSADLDSNYKKYGLSANAEVRSEQIKNAKTIMGVAKNIGFNQKGALIGLMTALTESDLINVEYGDLAGPDSRGLFQQRINGGWGSLSDVMNPSYSAQAFFLGVGGLSNPGLDSVAGWDSMDPWVAAQQVQRSAFSAGDNYRSKLDFADALVKALYEDSPAIPAVTSGKINPPKAGVNIQTSADGCATGSGGNSSTEAGDTYPAKNESYCRTSLCYAVQSADRVASGYRGECVDWAGWKIIEGTGTYGTHVPIAMGNATSWGDGARAHGIAVDMSPRAGDAVYWTSGQGGSGDAGHIGTVQSVNGTKVTIEEYNFAKSLPGDTPETGGGRYNTRVIEASNASGYIHFIDPNKSKEENKQYLIEKGILVPGKTNWPRS